MTWKVKDMDERPDTTPTRHGLMSEIESLTAENKRLRAEVVRLRDANEAWHVRITNHNQLYKLQEDDNERLREAIKQAIADSESGNGWGPDVTVVGYLRDALDEGEKS